MKVMLAEDDPGSAKLVIIILKRLGLVVDHCTDGAMVLESMSREAYDLVLMDMNLPVVDGLEVARRIRLQERDTGRHVPIVALTGYAFPEDRMKCLSAGMDDFLAKPLMIDQFQDKVRAWLGLDA